MTYITPAKLATGPEALSELAQMLSIDDPALLLATIENGDRSGWTADEVIASDAALVSILEYIGRANGEIDARLSHRGYSVPMSAAQFPVLSVWAAAIARYHLARMRDKTNEQNGRIERDYRDAIRALQLVADGRLSLGANDPLSVIEQPSTVEILSNPRMFSRGSLRNL